MGNISFNGISAKDLGYVVQTSPVQNFPAKDVATQHVYGRNGDLVIDKGSYTNVEREYSLGIPFLCGASFTATTSNLVNWLHSTSGYARLEDTYDPEVYRLAKFSDAGSFTNLCDAATTFKLKFDCKPQRYLKSGEKEIKMEGTSSVIRNNYLYESKPLITIEGLNHFSKYDVLMLETSNGNKTDAISIYSSDINSITIDSELQSAYSGNKDINDKIGLNGHDFPTLKTGENKLNLKHFSKKDRYTRSFNSLISDINSVCHSEYLPYDTLVDSNKKSYDLVSYDQIIDNDSTKYTITAFNQHLLDIADNYTTASLNEVFDKVGETYDFVGTFAENKEFFPPWLIGDNGSIIETNWCVIYTDKGTQQPELRWEDSSQSYMNAKAKSKSGDKRLCARGVSIKRSGWYRIKTQGFNTGIQYLNAGMIIFNPEASDWDENQQVSITYYEDLGTNQNSPDLNKIFEDFPLWMKAEATVSVGGGVGSQLTSALKVYSKYNCEIDNNGEANFDTGSKTVSDSASSIDFGTKSITKISYKPTKSSMYAYTQTRSFIKKAYEWTKVGDVFDEYRWNSYKSQFVASSLLSSSSNTSKTYHIISDITKIDYKPVVEEYTDANGNKRTKVVAEVMFNIKIIGSDNATLNNNNVQITAKTSGMFKYAISDNIPESKWFSLGKGSAINNNSRVFDLNTTYELWYHTSDVPTYVSEKNFPSWLNPTPLITGNDKFNPADESINLQVLRDGYYRYTLNDQVDKLSEFVKLSAGNTLQVKKSAGISYQVEYLGQDPKDLVFDNDRAFTDKEGVRFASSPSWIKLEYIWSSQYISSINDLIDLGNNVTSTSWEDIVVTNALDTIAFKEYCLEKCTDTLTATGNKTDSGYTMYSVKTKPSEYVSIENFVTSLDAYGFLTIADLQTIKEEFDAHKAMYNGQNLDPNASGTIRYITGEKGYYKLDNSTVWAYHDANEVNDALLISAYSDSSSIYFIPYDTMNNLASTAQYDNIELKVEFSSTGNPTTVYYSAKVDGYYRANSETDWVYRHVGDVILETTTDSTNTVYYLTEITDDVEGVTISITPRWWIL